PLRRKLWNPRGPRDQVRGPLLFVAGMLISCSGLGEGLRSKKLPSSKPAIHPPYQDSRAMDVRLVVKKGGATKKALRLKSEETIVGRRQDCDLRIRSSAVSRRHCLLSYHDDVLHVEDLDSVNGTYLNGARVSGRQIVKPGDLLEIGPARFIVQYTLSRS